MTQSSGRERRLLHHLAFILIVRLAIIETLSDVSGKSIKALIITPGRESIANGLKVQLYRGNLKRVRVLLGPGNGPERVIAKRVQNRFAPIGQHCFLE